ncbi:MAG: isoaspartyl peptidase/L-asparaginase [Gemmatimonadales bacterium]|jgi:beta-aspartyl-peptidase (threonine type)
MMDRVGFTLARLIVLSVPAVAASLGVSPNDVHAQESRAEWAIAVHGGAGTARPEDVGGDRERQFREKLTEALSAGGEILAAGGRALDAVEMAIRIMEDSPLFNAGKGAVFTHDGRNELDASIMDGATLEAGAVAAVHHVKNPITLARHVMDSSPHVLIGGAGAEEFALEQGIELVPTSYFFTESRWRSLQRALEAEQSAEARGSRELGAAGTVGVVALDRNGDLAAGTSTGGRTNKRYGRIGDSPIVGAGTYADNDACAVSGTGHGEFFITNAVAYDICARVRYLDETIRDAADYVVMGVLVEQGADGGVIAMDPNGDVAMPFNTSAMLRGYLRAGTEPEVAIFRD